MSVATTQVVEQFGQLGERRHYCLENDRFRRVKEPTARFGSGSVLTWVRNLLRFVLLPQGYPGSVSDDYLEYQLWDTLQAFCSYLSGTLTTRAVMQGVGVGDAAATPLAATLTWIMKDGTGMIGRIAFASWKGPELDSNCKKWRLTADALNDLALAIELGSPLLPQAHFLKALCVATSFKAIVGVAGGATRAALTQHQAKHGNMADVAAKDGSQETFVNLIASNIGIFLLPLVTSNEITWLVFLLLMCIHLFANYNAVRCLNIPILNATRFEILYQRLVTDGKVLRPKEVNSKEPVILGQSGASQTKNWNIVLGESFSALSDVSPEQLKISASLSEDYLVLVSARRKEIAVIFRRGATVDPLRTYFHAMCVGQALAALSTQESITMALTEGSKRANEEFDQFKKSAATAGWLMERHQLLVNEWVAEWTSKKHD
ncbi:RUS family member 1 [Cloeon dipterum]|uniref:RUS family member 1 n=1 Tax=Cloeon dipterum TaxID=197152 RepID=UPI00321F85F6